MRVRRLIPSLLLSVSCLAARAQLSLSSAVALALQNNPKVRMAQADVDRARAALSETKDVFIPSAGINGGIGKSSGPPLAVPQVFTVSANSLIFNFSERDYIRAAHAGLSAAQLSLEEVRNGVTEDVVITYFSLDSSVQRQRAALEAQAAAERLGTIVEGRFEAGVDPHIEVTRAHRTGLQMERQALSLEDDMDSLGEHLSNLVGLRLTGTDMIHSSIPTSFPQGTARVTDTPGLRSVQANADNKMYVARAQSRYLLRPQFNFGANYSYISTAFTNYDIYYTAFTRSANTNPNALSFGVQVSIPFLDFAHRARTREAMAEAVRARWEAADQRNNFQEANGKSLRSRRLLTLGADLAHVERDLAQDELDSILIQLQPGASPSPLTPKDEMNARLQVQQRLLDVLNADLVLEQTEVILMRQDGTLAGWLRSAAAGAPGVPEAGAAGTSVSVGKP